jgi:uncharacterized protein (TIGR02145 family)
MCYNLGVADGETADPLQPSQAIHGTKYKFGSATPALTMVQDQSNSGVVPNWSSLPYQSSGDWDMSTNNPCPTGYRVPTKAEWEGVVNPSLNPQKVPPGASWDDRASNYTSGYSFGENLFLPAAGNRSSSDGRLKYRGESGYYWSSTQSGNPHSVILSSNNAVVRHTIYRTVGYSVRCVAE